MVCDWKPRVPGSFARNPWMYEKKEDIGCNLFVLDRFFMWNRCDPFHTKNGCQRNASWHCIFDTTYFILHSGIFYIALVFISISKSSVERSENDRSRSVTGNRDSFRNLGESGAYAVDCPFSLVIKIYSASSSHNS